MAAAAGQSVATRKQTIESFYCTSENRDFRKPCFFWGKPFTLCASLTFLPSSAPSGHLPHEGEGKYPPAKGGTPFDPCFGSQTRARRGARGKPEGVYLDVNDRGFPQRNKVLRRVCKARLPFSSFDPCFGSQTRARRGARGKPEGAYTDICDRRLPQRNKVLRRVSGAKLL